MNAVNTKFSMPTLLTSWQWPWVIFTLSIFFGLVKLGLWQNNRAIDKQTRLDRIETLTTRSALPLAELLAISTSTDNAITEGINDLPVSLTGSFNNDNILLLDNQTFSGRLGYRTLQLFTDSTTGASVLVNMGWIQGSIDRNILPTLSTFTGPLTVTGNIRLIEKGIVLAEQQYAVNNWPLRVQQIEIDKFSQLFNIKLLPFVVYLDKKEQVGYKKNWQPVVMPPHKHQGYAVQWFSLAIAWLSLMIWASYKNQRHNKDITP